MSIVYLNGEFIAKEKATISVMDRGFLFGDGVYEVIPAYNGKLFRFENHIDRLYSSLDEIRLPLSLNRTEWHSICMDLLQFNAEFGVNQAIYLQVTRGFAADRNHAFPKELKPTIFIYTYPLKTISYQTLLKGMKVITAKDTRWQHCNIKATSLLANILLYQEAIDRFCAETLLIRDEKVVEGATSNFFIVKNNILKTPPISNLLLKGITRELILELARQHNIPYEEQDISLQALLAADEVWITSSTREIYPIVMVDNTPIGSGQPGPLWNKMIGY